MKDIPAKKMATFEKKVSRGPDLVVVDFRRQLIPPNVQR